MLERQCRFGMIGVATLIVSAGAPGVASADVIIIKNSSRQARTLSDLYAFPRLRNQGMRTEILKKGDATDDIDIAAGGIKNITVPDGTSSFTISWMNGAKEVEADGPVRRGLDVNFTYFQSPGFGGDVTVAFDDAPGILPDEGFFGTVSNGKIVGHPEYDWFTFYDTTASDAFIERDADGNPTSPLFDGSIEAVFGYTILAPSPATLVLMGAGGLVACGRRRR